MNQKSTPPSESLIERAAEVYDFQAALRAAGLAKPIGETAVEAVAVQAAAPVTLAAAPTLRAMPAAPSGPIVPIDLDMLREAGVIVPGAAPSALSEEFRLVKRQLLLSAFGGRKTDAIDKGQLILICSAQPNEGKTFCSVNLALSMSTETDIEVLLVDADVAKPEVLSTLGLPGSRGLMDALADPLLNVEDLIIRTSVPRLSVLPAGTQTNNDNELLASDRTAVIINSLIANNPRRVVLFDSAPALAASPASVIALNVGQVLLVVRADQTTESELRDALTLLDACPHVQLLLNAVTFTGTNRKFGSYYGFGE
ncbi:MAG: AAA family ATPase [Sphingomonadaceae bacterium]